MASSLSLSVQKLSPHSPNHNHSRFRRRLRSQIISAIPRNRIPSTPPTAPPGELYQPYRPPPSPLPSKFRSLDPSQRFEILRNRLGLWHEYAPLISSLARDGFTPPSIEEITGITSIQQNTFQVASQIRDSILSSSSSSSFLPFFDASSGAELLYELRFLNASQRAAAASHVADRRLDPKDANELARAIKDFPRRRGEEGWKHFSAASPGDCVAYTDFRLSREVLKEGDWMAVLEKAMGEAETESARTRIEEEMERRKKGEDKEEEGMEKEASSATTVPVVRLRYGEVAEATSVVLLPVCKAEEGVEEAPELCRVENVMGVVEVDKGWRRWVVLPRWGPVAGVGEKGGVAVEFADGRMLPWRKNRWEKEEEGVIVVVDRKRNKVEEEVDELYLVRDVGKGKGVMVERGKKVLEMGKKFEALAVVVMVVRPPKEEDDDQLKDEDWE